MARVQAGQVVLEFRGVSTLIKFMTILSTAALLSFGFLKGSEVVVKHLKEPRVIVSKYTPNQSDEFSSKQKVTE